MQWVIILRRGVGVVNLGRVGILPIVKVHTVERFRKKLGRLFVSLGWNFACPASKGCVGRGCLPLELKLPRKSPREFLKLAFGFAAPPFLLRFRVGFLVAGGGFGGRAELRLYRFPRCRFCIRLRLLRRGDGLRRSLGQSGS